MVLLHDAPLLPLGLETHHFPGLKFARMDFSWTSPVQPVRKNVWALLVFRFPKVLSHVMRLRSCMIRWVSCNHLTGGPPGFWGKIPDPKVETGRNLANQVKLGVAPLLNRRDHFPFKLCEAPAKSLLGHTECKDSSYLTSFATCVSWLDLEIKGQFLLLLIPNGILEGFRNSTLGRFAIAERQRIHG